MGPRCIRRSGNQQMRSAQMLKAVRDAVAKVTDPEYPEVTIEQLGILERVFSSGEKYLY